MAGPETTPSSRRAPAPARPGRVRQLVQVALWVGAAVLLAESVFGDRGFTAMIEARREHQSAQASLDRVRAENAALRARARRLREDPEAIEEIARRDLRLAAPGEIVFIIKDLQDRK